MTHGSGSPFLAITQPERAAAQHPDHSERAAIWGASLLNSYVFAEGLLTDSEEGLDCYIQQFDGLGCASGSISGCDGLAKSVAEGLAPVDQTTLWAM